MNFAVLGTARPRRARCTPAQADRAGHGRPDDVRHGWNSRARPSSRRSAPWRCSRSSPCSIAAPRRGRVFAVVACPRPPRRPTGRYPARRCHALLPLLLGRRGGYVASVAIAGDLNPLTVPSPPSTGLLARGRPGAFNYDGAWLQRAAFGSSPELPPEGRVRAHRLRRAEHVRGRPPVAHPHHRGPSLAGRGAAVRALAAARAVARPDPGETGGICSRPPPPQTSPAVSSPGRDRTAVAGGDDPALGHRPQGGTDRRGDAGKTLRVVVTWDVEPLALTMTTPAGKPVQFRPFGRGAVAEVPRAKAGAYASWRARRGS